MKALTMFLAALAAPVVMALAQSGSQPYQPAVPASTYSNYGYDGYYGGGTPAGSALQGMASVISAQGNYNLATSAAAVNLTHAQREYIQNRQQWTTTYFDLRATNRAARAAERGPPPTNEQIARIAAQGIPKPLDFQDVDPVSGQVAWPSLLHDEAFDLQRAEIEKLLTKQSHFGGLGTADQKQAHAALDIMSDKLREQIRNVPPQKYLASAKFLKSLKYSRAPVAVAGADGSIAELIQSSQLGAEASRIKAIDALAAEGEKAAEAVGALTQLLTDNSPSVRAHAAHALKAIGAPSQPAAAALLSLLKDGDETVRRQAIQALAAIRLGPQAIIPLFVKLMEDSDPGVRMRILHAVSEAGAAAVPALIEALQNEKAAYWACLVLREIGPDAKDAVSALAATLHGPDVELRREAALTLGAMQAAARPAVPALAAALEDEHARVAVTFALGQIGQISEKAERSIRTNAASGDKFLSTVSYWTLARLHPEDKALLRQTIELLVDRIMDQDPYVRIAAARALAALPPAPEIALPIWEKALANADETTTHHAMDALASLGPAAVPRLIHALQHKKLRAQAAHILGEIGPAAAPASDALARLTAERETNVASEAALALAKIGPEAKAAVPALSAALRQKDNPAAHAIVYALGKIGPGAMAAEPAILDSLESEDRSLAVLSAWALTQLHPSSQQIAARTLPTLIRGLEDPLPQTRTAAAEALGSLGRLARQAAGALQKASQDQNPEVRDAAAAALRSI